MRAGFALFLCVVGCRTIPVPENTETHAALPTSTLVAVPSLAADLDLAYEGEADGFIKLVSPPDHVMLVPDSRRAYVNGRNVEMTYPCMWRGQDYVLSNGDAALVRRTLLATRSRRAVPLKRPPPLVVKPRVAPVVRRAPSGLPLRWRPRQDANPVNWKYIVVHHMASGSGSAAAIHRLHLQRGFDGMGYHFVIGNGSLTSDGQVEVGYRWKNQIHGAHAKAREGDPRRESNYYNRFGIGICLVGYFSDDGPSRAQMTALHDLVARLRTAYDIPARNVVPHRSVSQTRCPGVRFPWKRFSDGLRR